MVVGNRGWGSGRCTAWDGIEINSFFAFLLGCGAALADEGAGGARGWRKMRMVRSERVSE